MSVESSSHGDIFITTRWTVVLAAADRDAPEAERALEEICQTYWFPLYAYIRRRGHPPEDAEDLAQEFFRQLLEHHWIGDVDRAKGRLRAFLITALKHFMAKEWRKASAQKRGGLQRTLSLDSSIAESRYASTATPGTDAEALFDREWALTLLDLTFNRLEQEYLNAGKADLFARLKEGLVMTHQAINYPELSAYLRMTEGAIRVTIHRMRKRFRELYRAEIAQTLPPGADLDDELRHLAESLARE
jgi:RNA polymerase sigma factor (sigma-70 family)